jgi:hypothetical protein
MNTNEEFINEESAATQCNRILAHLKKGLTITSLEALQMFGCMRLASRIHDLRVRGENIVVEKVKLANGKSVAQYHLAV